MKRDDLPLRGYEYACTSGNTSALVVPSDTIGHLEEMEIDTAEISGNISLVTVKVNDTYTPQDGSEETTTRVQKSLKCGDVIHVDLDGNYPLIGVININTNISGPVVSLGVAFEY